MNVGDQIMSQRTYTDLPVGSTIRGTYVWTKIDENTWMRPGGSGPITRGNDSLNATGRVRIASIGTGTYATGTVEVGALLTTAAQWQALPIGTVIGRRDNESSRHHYRKSATDSFENVSTGDVYTADQFSSHIDGRYLVVALPDKVVASYETPDKFMWMFHEVVAAAAENHGVGQSVVTDAIRNIGHPVPPLAAGAEVRWERTREKLPEGSIVYCGYPTSPLRFGVFKKSRTGWTHILGPTKRMDHTIRVDFIPGVDAEWALDPGSEETAREAAALRAKAWHEGIKVKHAHGWCGELEAILHRAGLSADSINAARDFSLRVGSFVTMDQAAPLPEGTIFRWQDGDNYCYYKRDNARSRNASRTRRIFGHRADGGTLRHYATQMEILHLGDEPLNLRLPINGSNFEMIPAGSAWHFNGGSTTGPAYVMAQDHRASSYSTNVPLYGTWSLADLIGTTERDTLFTFTNLETS